MRIKLILLIVVMLSPSALDAQSQQKAALDKSKTKTGAAEQINQQPTVSILKNLESNIKKIKPSMTENDVLNTLGLIRYKVYLKSKSFIRMDGAGGNWRVLLDDCNGYSLAFRDFMGHGNAKCMIRTPNRKFWIDAKTSIPATTTKERQADLNKQMKKYRLRLAKQNETKDNVKSRQSSK